MVLWHDFNASILSNDTMHIERCINYIHRFINTGIFKEFYTYNNENRNKGISHFIKYEFDERTNSFIPIYTREELDIIIQDSEEKIRKCKDDIWRKYEERRKEYFIEVKFRLFQRGDIII